jgi:hypothetical protein
MSLSIREMLFFHVGYFADPTVLLEIYNDNILKTYFVLFLSTAKRFDKIVLKDTIKCTF